MPVPNKLLWRYLQNTLNPESESFSFCSLQFPHLLKSSWYFRLMTWLRKQHCNTGILLTQVTIFINLLTKIIPSLHTTRFSHTYAHQYQACCQGHIFIPFHSQFTNLGAITQTPVSSFLWDQQLCYCRDSMTTQRQFILHVRHKAVMCYTESTCIVCLHEYFYIKFHLLSAGILLKVHHCTPQKLL